MLEDALSPLIEQLEEDQVTQSNFDVVHKFFSKNEQPLGQISDLPYLCTLSLGLRKSVTYPVLGNWYLSAVHAFQTSNSLQERQKELLLSSLKQKRFFNDHLSRFVSSQEVDAHIEDELNALMIEDMQTSRPLYEFVADFTRGIASSTEANRSDEYQVDIGHGIHKPAGRFLRVMRTYQFMLKYDVFSAPLDARILVLDDTEAEEWYGLALRVGFSSTPGVSGRFTDPESALHALQNNVYDVILSDLELGVDKYTGADFLKEAYSIQKQNGRSSPLISLFSHNQEALQHAKNNIGVYLKDDDVAKRFFESTTNNKLDFSMGNLRLFTSSHKKT